MDMNYEHMSTGEIIAYYKRVRDYIDQGFRVEGLRDELFLISNTFKVKSVEMNEPELHQYVQEIEKYLETIRH
ncbi:hypothetical protein BKP35_09230 [Anaerobacillus arseniciselenatis]|uniref:Uncharacterized protein n=1 Tax=Anaerobacillus arseniciselenatis TaxID=85682 RepID=A0A1S2LKB7_9BACI|nr:hypothetical protein [Anaerobacillus arseniciselenatis]OIJ12754.1 hypothetical protein BKP35_09230 [Anaerobacillus arseniciselenatis]